MRFGLLIGRGRDRRQKPKRKKTYTAIIGAQNQAFCSVSKNEDQTTANEAACEHAIHGLHHTVSNEPAEQRNDQSNRQFVHAKHSEGVRKQGTRCGGKITVLLLLSD